MTLDSRLDAILAARDRDAMQPTIDALLAVYEEFPEDARVLYEVGGAYDTAGEEATARGYYERAMAAGLSGDVRRRCFLQYGSTLRNLGEYGASLEAFRRAREEFPEAASLPVFEALTWHAAGNTHEAVALLLEVVADSADAPDLERYLPALRGNASFIRSLGRADGSDG